MANHVRAQWQELQQIAQGFQQQSEAANDMAQSISSKMQPLQDGGWIGMGSDAFFQEMEELVTPGVKRLIDALAEASQKASQIAQTLSEHEQQASGLFKQR